MTTMTEIKQYAARYKDAVEQAVQERPFDVEHLCATDADIRRAMDILGPESDWCKRCWNTVHHLEDVNYDFES